MAQMDPETVDLLALLGINEPRQSLALGRRTGSRIRLLHGSTSSTGTYAPRPQEERRRDQRLTPDQSRFSEAAKLRPGFDVRVVDIGTRGVLIEAPTRLHIGMRVELALFASDTGVRLDLAGTVRRCHVSSLNPLTYRGALEFDRAIEVTALGPFLETAALTA